MNWLIFFLSFFVFYFFRKLRFNTNSFLFRNFIFDTLLDLFYNKNKIFCIKKWKILKFCLFYFTFFSFWMNRALLIKRMRFPKHLNKIHIRSTVSNDLSHWINALVNFLFNFTFLFWVNLNLLLRILNKMYFKINWTKQVLD